jgi:hypothetical protein
MVRLTRKLLASATTTPGRRRGSPLWTWIPAVEVVLAAATVVLDLGLPTLVVLGMAVVSLAIRRTGFASRGVHRVHHGWLLAGKMLLVAAGRAAPDEALLELFTRYNHDW